MSDSRKPATVDEYLAAQPSAVQPLLAKVREAIRKALPDAVEVISYGMAGYKVNGRNAIFFAGWKQHYSIYPASAAMVAAFAEELQPFEVEKGTIRFPYSRPAPVKLIAALAKFRAAELSAGSARPKRKP